MYAKQHKQPTYGMTNVNIKSLMSSLKHDRSARSTPSPKPSRLSPPSTSLCPSFVDEQFSSSDSGSTVSATRSRPDHLTLSATSSSSNSSSNNRTAPPSVAYRERFRPRFASRAHLNIFTAKDQTKLLRTLIAEDFESEQVLYYYIDISTALQMNDAQMNIFHLSDGRQLALLHFDLHCKWSHRALYGVVTPNRTLSDSQPISSANNKSKWRWQMECFLDAEQIANRYGLTDQDLPHSSRAMHSFKAQLTEPPKVNELVFAHTDWSTVQQIKSLKRSKKGKKGGSGKGKHCKNSPLRLSEGEWHRDIHASLVSAERSECLLPVVINKNNAHWVEWVQIVRVQRFGVFVGISLKRRGCSREWTVQSIDLDVGRIFNKHSLVALVEPLYTKAMRDVHAMHNQRFPAISELTWNSSAEMAMNQQRAMAMPRQMVLAPPVLHNRMDVPMGVLGAELDADREAEWVGQIVDDVLTQTNSKGNGRTHYENRESQIYQNYQKLAQSAQMQFQFVPQYPQCSQQTPYQNRRQRPMAPNRFQYAQYPNNGNRYPVQVPRYF